MRFLLGLPAALLLCLLDNVEAVTVTTFSLISITKTISATALAGAGAASTGTAPLASTSTTTGSGYAFASSCNSAALSYASYTSSWIQAHATVQVSTVSFGVSSVVDVTYYLNASTLCDGHPRVTYSPAVPLYTKAVSTSAPITATSVYTQTGWNGSPSEPSPACYIQPKDCDSIWQDYTTSLRSYQAQTITASPPHTPFCANVSAAASYASAESIIRGCGDCTIYGDGVELLFFPPPATVSRDMCASTQSGTLTHYGTDDVITAYHGKSRASYPSNTGGAEVVEYDGHAFTSGTAYISISSVWAVDRCSENVGSTLYDAVLAMKSADVLSLRYSQDHFQAVMSTDQQTGYPLSYADFKNPIPYSAWVGQIRCDGPWDSYRCGVVYENDFRPQLAIPPGIKKLDPKWSTCQMYFRGLYDPPVALQRVSTAAGITPPGGAAYPATTTASLSQSNNNGLTTPAQPAPPYRQVTPTKQADSEPTTTAFQPQHEAQSTSTSRQPQVVTTTIDLHWSNTITRTPQTVKQRIAVVEQHTITVTFIQQSPESPYMVQCSDLSLSTVLPVGSSCTVSIPASLGGQPDGQGQKVVGFNATGGGVVVQYQGNEDDAEIDGSGNTGQGASPSNNNSNSSGPSSDSGSDQSGDSKTGGTGGQSSNSGSSSSGSSTTPATAPSSGGQTTTAIQQASGANRRDIWVHHLTAVLMSTLYFAII